MDRTYPLYNLNNEASIRADERARILKEVEKLPDADVYNEYSAELSGLVDRQVVLALLTPPPHDHEQS